MDASELSAALLKDSPFSYPHPDERTKSLLVETSSVKLYEQELALRFRTVSKNSLVTAIIGRARSGKTHFIYHLDYLTNSERKVGGICVYLPLHGEDLNYSGLVSRIALSEEFRERAQELGLFLSETPGTDDIKRVVAALRIKHGDDAGVILAVDNLDEHFRQREAIAKERGISPKDDIQSFLGLFRLLTGERGVDKGMCVILSMTEDAYNKVEQFLTDPTLRERFDFVHDPTDPGRILRLSELSEDEAWMLVAKYMEHWANRNEVILPSLERCRVDDKNLFPFTKEAVELFWGAGSFAGHLCLACNRAISRKCSQPIKSEEDLVISEADAAYALSASAGMFPNFPSLKPRIELLIGGPQLESEVRKWIETVAKTRFDSDLWKAAPLEAFHGYLAATMGGAHLAYDLDKDVSFIDPYSGKGHVVHFVVGLPDGSMGISLTHGALVDALEGGPIALGLKNTGIKWGVFVHLGKEPGGGFQSERASGIGMDLFELLLDDVGGLDFNAVVKTVHLDELSAWGIIRCRELADPAKRQKMYGWIEGRVQFLRVIEVLSSAGPRIRQGTGVRTAGELLDRGGA